MYSFFIHISFTDNKSIFELDWTVVERVYHTLYIFGRQKEKVVFPYSFGRGVGVGFPRLVTVQWNTKKLFPQPNTIDIVFFITKTKAAEIPQCTKKFRLDVCWIGYVTSLTFVYQQWPPTMYEINCVLDTPKDFSVIIEDTTRSLWLLLWKRNRRFRGGVIGILRSLLL